MLTLSLKKQNYWEFTIKMKGKKGALNGVSLRVFKGRESPHLKWEPTDLAFACGIQIFGKMNTETKRSFFMVFKRSI